MNTNTLPEREQMVDMITKTLDKQDVVEEGQIADWLKGYIEQPPNEEGPNTIQTENLQLSSEVEPLGAGIVPDVKNEVTQEVKDVPQEAKQEVKQQPQEPQTQPPIHITPSESVEEAQAKLLEQIDQLTSNIEFKLQTNYNDTTMNNLYSQFLVGMTLIPSSSLNKLDLNNYIASVTTFNYNCFDSPDVLLQHNIPNKIAIVKHVNDMFHRQFMDISPTHDNRYNFTKLTQSIVKYLWDNKEVGTTLLEYSIIKSFIGKLIINLSTNVELGLSNDKRINNITNQFYNAVMQDVTDMKYIQSLNGKTAQSWKAFVGALLGTTDKNIYKRTNLLQLNNQIKTAFSYDFMLETMLANMLKTYIPSIIINYFYAVKSMYIMVRLMSIYIDRLHRKKQTPSREQILTDLSAIAGLSVIIYENLSFVFRIVPRSMPSYSKGISDQFQMYITNHLVVGGQYYLLKMLEKSLPAIVDLIRGS